ncbi:MAG: FtsB family cell division protein [Thermovirgaceae bacterium]
MPRLRWVVLFAAALCILAIIGTAYIMEIQKIRRLSLLVDQRMDRLVRTNREIQALEDKIRFYNTPEGIARLAREQFNLTFPGEQIFRIEVVSDDHLPGEGR